MNYILKGIYLGTKLILLGDVNQLPSVGPGNILKDIIQSERIATAQLTEIFRQAEESKIIVNSHRVNEGETFTDETKNDGDSSKQQDFFYVNESSQAKALDTVISLCTGRLESYGNYEFFSNIQVLSPTKKGTLGTKELNRSLQEALNPLEEHSKESAAQKAHGDRVFRIGDRVMQIKNNYDIYWEKVNEVESGAGIFNGEMGAIKEIDDTTKAIEILFDDDKKAWYEFGDLEQLEHSYAVTIHKSQRK